MTTPPEQPHDVLPPGVTERIIAIELDVESLGGLRKKAVSKQYGGFTLFSDEAHGPGLASADPPPMVYFACAIAF